MKMAAYKLLIRPNDQENILSRINPVIYQIGCTGKASAAGTGQHDIAARYAFKAMGLGLSGRTGTYPFPG